ncbi:MAG: Isoquinoline 1-oxidoreductase subunit [Alphaproteobacteria bacterium]|nr:MAG: Isoquinoline 1-oxidoreductase subunit [Alphaproteobacteria bacterium]
MRPLIFGAMGAALAATAAFSQIQNTGTLNPKDLRPVSSFGSIPDQAERSRALFNEIAKVVTHPRCMNCHPAGEHPLQGADHHEHAPPAYRGEGGVGIAGLTCNACHTEKNFTLVGTNATYKSIPGHPRWGLAPVEMAWQGKSLGQICQQMKDPARNGGRTLALLQEHLAHDDLVAWGWAPGEGREPAPGTQAQLGELTQAWINSGAECP